MVPTPSPGNRTLAVDSGAGDGSEGGSMPPAPEGPRPTAQVVVAGSGEPLVLVPGALTGWNTFGPHAERLARARRVVRTQLLNVELGLRGDPLPADYSLKTESRALARALDDLDVARADLVGWSYGGGIALDFALDHPERVRTLTLIEPEADWVLRRLGRPQPGAEALRRVMEEYGPGEVSEEQLERFLFEVGFLPEGTDARSLPRWPEWVRHRNSLRIGDTPSRHEDEPARLRAFERPVLLFEGEGSPEHMRATVEALEQEFPNARTEELPGAHGLVVVAMERFLEILEAFLASPGNR